MYTEENYCDLISHLFDDGFYFTMSISTKINMV